MISIITLVAVYTATDVVFGSANEEFTGLGHIYSECIANSGTECSLFGGGGE